MHLFPPPSWPLAMFRLFPGSSAVMPPLTVYLCLSRLSHTSQPFPCSPPFPTSCPIPLRLLQSRRWRKGHSKCCLHLSEGSEMGVSLLDILQGKDMRGSCACFNVFLAVWGDGLLRLSFLCVFLSIWLYFFSYILLPSFSFGFKFSVLFVSCVRIAFRDNEQYESELFSVFILSLCYVLHAHLFIQFHLVTVLFTHFVLSFDSFMLIKSFFLSVRLSVSLYLSACLSVCHSYFVMSSLSLL